jgi:FkbM family methyltransferase
MELKHLNSLIGKITSSLIECNSEQILAISPIENSIKFSASTIKVNERNASSNWIRSKHLNGDVHEPATIAALLYIASKGNRQIDCFYDVGALYGYFSLISNKIFKKLEVYSFEMNPHSYLMLKNNIISNNDAKNFKLINIGLSNHSKLNAKVKVNGFILDENGADTLDLLTVDKFSFLTNSKPDLIKIDVEGYQTKIIPGAINVIQKYRPYIIAEFDNLQTMLRLGATNKEVFTPLFELGYKMYWCKNHRSRNSEFIEVSYDDFCDEHEVNSLAIFEPNLFTI